MNADIRVAEKVLHDASAALRESPHDDGLKTKHQAAIQAHEKALVSANERLRQANAEGRVQAARDAEARRNDLQKRYTALASGIVQLEDELAPELTKVIATVRKLDSAGAELKLVGRELGIWKPHTSRFMAKIASALIAALPEVSSRVECLVNNHLEADSDNGLLWVPLFTPEIIGRELRGGEPLTGVALKRTLERLDIFAASESREEALAEIAKRQPPPPPAPPALETRGTFFGTALRAIVGTPGEVTPLQEPSNLSPGDITEKRRAAAERIVFEADQASRARRLGGGDPGPSAA